MRLKQFEAFWNSFGDKSSQKLYQSDIGKKAKEEKNKKIIDSLLKSSGDNYSKIEIINDTDITGRGKEYKTETFKVSLNDSNINSIKSISDKIDRIEVTLLNDEKHEGYAMYTTLYLNGNDYVNCSINTRQSNGDSHSSLYFKSERDATAERKGVFVIQIDKYFSSALDSESLDKSLETISDKLSEKTILSLLEESSKRLIKRKRDEYIKSNIDEIKSCFYELIDISNTHRIFPNQADGITLIFEIDDIKSKDATFQINDKMSMVLNILLEAKGRLGDIIDDCVIKITFDAPSIQITIS